MTATPVICAPLVTYLAVNTWFSILPQFLISRLGNQIDGRGAPMEGLWNIQTKRWKHQRPQRRALNKETILRTRSSRAGGAELLKTAHTNATQRPARSRCQENIAQGKLKLQRTSAHLFVGSGSSANFCTYSTHSIARIAVRITSTLQSHGRLEYKLGRLIADRMVPTTRPAEISVMIGGPEALGKLSKAARSGELIIA